jgi:hypothetical protein
MTPHVNPARQSFPLVMTVEALKLTPIEFDANRRRFPGGAAGVDGAAVGAVDGAAVATTGNTST